MWEAKTLSVPSTQLSPNLAERYVRIRHDSRNDKDTHCIFLQRKKSLSSPRRHIGYPRPKANGRYLFEMAGMRGGLVRPSQASAGSYIVSRTSKDVSSKHSVPLALWHSSSGNISDVDIVSRRSNRLTMQRIRGMKSLTAENS